MNSLGMNRSVRTPRITVFSAMIFWHSSEMIQSMNSLALSGFGQFFTSATPSGTAEFFAFYDCGQLKHKTESEALSSASEAFLSSTGCGLRCGLLNHLNASFTMAMPLKKHDYNLRDNKPHWLFAVSAEF